MIKQHLEDTLEKLAEQGSTHAKKAAKTTVRQVASTFSPTKMWEEILGVDSSPAVSADKSRHSPDSKESSGSAENYAKKNHTPLNFDSLNSRYRVNDSQKETDLKNRLFQLVKQGEEKVLAEKKQAEKKKKNQEQQSEENKKQKEQAKQKDSQQDGIPKGKVRKSIFSAKKIAERQQTETRPSSGKQ